MKPLYLHITSVPSGEAPLWVRQKWVGLALPLAQASADPMRRGTFGVLTGPKNFFTVLLAKIRRQYRAQEGHIVEVGAAMTVLQMVQPDAAAWWRQNTPHMMRAGKKFMFEQGCGHVTQGP